MAFAQPLHLDLVIAEQARDVGGVLGLGAFAPAGPPQPIAQVLPQAPLLVGGVLVGGRRQGLAQQTLGQGHGGVEIEIAVVVVHAPQQCQEYGAGKRYKPTHGPPVQPGLAPPAPGSILARSTLPICQGHLP